MYDVSDRGYGCPCPGAGDVTIYQVLLEAHQVNPVFPVFTLLLRSVMKVSKPPSRSIVNAVKCVVRMPQLVTLSFPELMCVSLV